MVSIAWELSRIKELSQVKSFCFAGKITGTKATTPEIFLGLNPSEDGCWSSENRYNKRMAPRSDFFLREDCGNKGHNPKKLSWI
jgi:hypothetical protein